MRPVISAAPQSARPSGQRRIFAWVHRFNFVLQDAELKGGRICDLLWVGLAQARPFGDSYLPKTTKAGPRI
jgi:hypothetical protein